MENNEMMGFAPAAVADVVNTVAPAAPAVAPVTTTVPSNDGMSLGKKIAFYGFIGLLAISGIGIPVAFILIKRKNKDLKRYKELYGELPPEQPKAPVVAAPAPQPVAQAVVAPVAATPQAPVQPVVTPEQK